ncbi:MAG: D-alanyl-D-alanine carboxypeptidase, partial [Lachnospiraceae bacterium]|nr:D-alanyl-D-alanine carboxypeptidase [Candidatus Equihabitans merdae]
STLTGTCTPVSAEPIPYPSTDGVNVASETACLMDADTGAILYNKDMDRQMYPASITKVMTTMLALEYGNLSDQVTMTSTGVAYVQSYSSNLGTLVGEVFTLEQLLYGTMLKSANDMATQVGEYIGGTLPSFIDLMNHKAEELGCTNTHFANACGMPDETHYTSAHDMVLIGQEAIKNEEFRKIVGTHTYTIPPTNMYSQPREFSSHNPLLTNPDYAFPGIIGGKTGNTNAAGNTLTTYTSNYGRTLVVCTLKGSSAPDAASDNVNLHTFGSSFFDNIEVIGADVVGRSVKATVPSGGSAADVEIAETPEGDGARLTFTYAGHDAGFRVLNKEEHEAWQKANTPELAIEEESDSQPAAAVDDDSQEEEVEQMHIGAERTPMSGALKVGIGFVVALLVLLLIFKLWSDYMRALRRRRRRNSIKNKRKREDKKK